MNAVEIPQLVIAMIYRMRIYSVAAKHVDTFNAFFNQHLLPIQLRHGARLVGRWHTEDDRVVAIWEYDSRDAYQRIHDAVVHDPDSAKAKAVRSKLPQLFDSMQETLMESTVQS
jgi:hypothetical protein